MSLIYYFCSNYFFRVISICAFIWIYAWFFEITWCRKYIYCRFTASSDQWNKVIIFYRVLFIKHIGSPSLSNMFFLIHIPVLKIFLAFDASHMLHCDIKYIIAITVVNYILLTDVPCSVNSERFSINLGSTITKNYTPLFILILYLIELFENYFISWELKFCCDGQ